jgi:hypothetical protein
VRILLRTDGRVEAGKVAKSAERKARGPLKTFAIMARAEVMLADDQPKIAAEYLRSHLEEDEGVGTLLIDALLRASEKASSPDEHDELVEQAASVPISTTLSHNVPVQVVLVRLAMARRDRAAFDTVLANLAATRINPGELQRLRLLW